MKFPEVLLDLNQPSDVATDSNGNVYVLDKDNNRIWKFNSNGKFITRWGTMCAYNGQFNSPYEIAVDGNGNIYVSDTNNNRIQVFNSDGTFIRKWGYYGSANGQFGYPRGIAVDRFGNVYVADYANHRIQKFSSTGRFITKWGSEGSNDGQFSYPYGITVDNSGNVYVTDMNNHRVQKFSSDGTFIRKWGYEGLGYDGYFNGSAYKVVNQVMTWQDAKLYSESLGGHLVTISSQDENEFVCNLMVESGISRTFWIGLTDESEEGNFVWVTGEPIIYTNWAPGEPNNLADEDYVEVDSRNGNWNDIYNDGGSNGLHPFVIEFELEGDISETKFLAPRGIAVDSFGFVYVVDTGNNRIQKFTSDGEFLTKWGGYGTIEGRLDQPYGVAVDGNGNVYVADTNNNRVQKFTSDGAFLEVFCGRHSNGQFYYPNEVAIDTNGNIYVADTYNNRVQKFTGDGVFLKKWGSYGSKDGQFYYPHGIAVDSNGNVYVADTGNGCVQKFTGDGIFLKKWGSEGSSDGQFYYPHGIAFDSNGNIYVADTGNHRIQVFRPTGSPDIVSAQIYSYSPNDPSNPMSVEAGNDADISMTIRNNGNVAWQFVASLDIWDANDNLVGTYEETLSDPLSPGQQKDITWKHKIIRSGEYKLQFAIWKSKPFISDNLLDKKPSSPQVLIVGIITDRVTDLTARSGASGKIIYLEWTAPFPESADEYIVRYNKVPITESNWDESTDVSGEPAPDSPGTKQSMTVTFQRPGGVYYFAIKARYGSKYSPISNSPCSRVPIQLRKGWNLVGFIQNYDSMPLADAISGISDNFVSAWTYTSTGWKKYIKGVPDTINDLLEMEPGCGYWINVSSDCAWDFGGVLDNAPSANMRKPPFLMYGKIISNGSPVDGLEITLRHKGIRASSYKMGRQPRYGEYYVLEVPMNDRFKEGDNVRIYVDGVTSGESISLGGIGTARRYDIAYIDRPTISKLHQNYPNPFNPETWIPYQLSEGSEVVIKIYTSSGQLVRTLDIRYKPSGYYITREKSAYWDGRNEAGELVSSGIYFYVIEAGKFTGTQRMILLR